MEKSYTNIILDEITQEIDKVVSTLKIQERQADPRYGYVLNREERRREARRNKKIMKRGKK